LGGAQLKPAVWVCRGSGGQKNKGEITPGGVTEWEQTKNHRQNKQKKKNKRIGGEK